MTDRVNFPQEILRKCFTYADRQQNHKHGIPQAFHATVGTEDPI